MGAAALGHRQAVGLGRQAQRADAVVAGRFAPGDAAEGARGRRWSAGGRAPGPCRRRSGLPLEAVELRVRAQTTPATSTTTAATAEITIRAGFELLLFPGAAPAATASVAAAATGSVTFFSRVFFCRGGLGVRRAPPAWLGAASGSAGLVVRWWAWSGSRSSARPHRERGLAACGREIDTGGVITGASDGAVGAVGTDLGYSLNGVGGLGSLRIAAVTGGGGGGSGPARSPAGERSDARGPAGSVRSPKPVSWH